LRIHPFNNGNGRVIREIMSNWFIELGSPFLRLPNSGVLAYLGVLQRADAGDGGALIDYFCRLVIATFDVNP